MHVTPQEHEAALDLLEQTRRDLVQAVAGLSQAEWHAKPAPDRWSIAETLEHIVLLELAFHLKVVPALQSGPPPTRDTRAVDELIRERVPDRGKKYQVPAPLVPTGRWDEVECVKRFGDARQRTIEFTQNPIGFRERTVEHPVLGPLDTYQWVLMVALHGARHAEQIREVRLALSAA